MAAYVGGGSGSGDTHTSQVISGGHRVTSKANPAKIAKKVAANVASKKVAKKAAPKMPGRGSDSGVEVPGRGAIDVKVEVPGRKKLPAKVTPRMARMMKGK